MRLEVCDQRPPDAGGMRGVPIAVDADSWYWQRVGDCWERIADVYGIAHLTWEWEKA